MIVFEKEVRWSVCKDWMPIKQAACKKVVIHRFGLKPPTLISLKLKRFEL